MALPIADNLRGNGAYKVYRGYIHSTVACSAFNGSYCRVELFKVTSPVRLHEIEMSIASLSFCIYLNSIGSVMRLEELGPSLPQLWLVQRLTNCPVSTGDWNFH